MLQIIKDARLRPELFVWNGPIESQELGQWLSENEFNLPEDFVVFLELTSGGDLFESETILGPFGDIELGDDLLGANMSLRSDGMPPGYVVFHQGVYLSAIRCSDQKYVTFTERDFQEKAVFSSFETWYIEGLRKEYSERYSLGPISVA